MQEGGKERMCLALYPIGVLVHGSVETWGEQVEQNETVSLFGDVHVEAGVQS